MMYFVFNAFATLAPLSFILLFDRSRVISEVFTFNALANISTPSSFILLLYNSRVFIEVFTFNAFL